jgi:hypothetical protein
MEIIKAILERKRNGVDCTEAESAEIKGYLREYKLPEEQSIVAEIQELFPQEYGEYLDEENIITDREEICRALMLPFSITDSFLPKELKPVAKTIFKGDARGEPWSINKFFTIGKTYPVYEYEGLFVVGSDKGGFKIAPAAWTEIKYF